MRDISTAQLATQVLEWILILGNHKEKYILILIFLFREFLELDAELPKANQTSALSGKSMMKMISKVGDRVSQYTTKMEETDQWFEEKTVMIDNLDLQLRKLLVATEAMVDYRKGLSGHTYSLS